MFRTMLVNCLLCCSLLISLLIGPSSASAGPPRPPLPPLPPLFIPVPPPVVPVPGVNVYIAPDVDADLLFYHGFWYRPFEGRWYRSARYDGPWGFVPGKRVPRELRSLPPGYRGRAIGGERIPHGQLKKNWRTWERDGHRGDPGRHDRPERRGKPHREKRAEGNGPHGPGPDRERGGEHGGGPGGGHGR